MSTQANPQAETSGIDNEHVAAKVKSDEYTRVNLKNSLVALFTHEQDGKLALIDRDGVHNVDMDNRECSCGNFGEPDIDRGTPSKTAQKERAKARCKHADVISEVSLSLTAPHTTCDDINTEDEYRSLRVEVAQLWDNDSDSIEQVGLIADDDGKTKFTIFDGGVPANTPLEEGNEYELVGVQTSKFNGKHEVIINDYTQVRKL